MLKQIEPSFGELAYYKPNDLQSAFRRLEKIFLNLNYRCSTRDGTFQYSGTHKTVTIHGVTSLLHVLLYVETKNHRYGVGIEPRSGVVSIKEGNNQPISRGSLTIDIGNEQLAREVHAMFYWINFMSL
ncbi:MAG: hypothetical protein DWQ02_08395 [Bacteroidetes bacterium]|nr:MAG: hypothetical protein DWQ02_08395 [Bacteroidota bacterium]